MKNKFILLFTTTITAFLLYSFSFKKLERKPFQLNWYVQDTIKQDTIQIDSLALEANFNYKLYKTKAHASYYANKFHGKRTASGERFDNNKYTAAHKKLAFGTKLRITNPKNGKKLIVKVNDRGPFVKGREIDLSRSAYMYLTTNKSGGEMNVKIEIQQSK